MISRRVIVNVITFIVLSSILLVWVVTTYFQLGFAAPDVFVVTAQFEESPGLREDFQVSYLGHDVGRIGTVTLAAGKVFVELRIGSDERIPREVTASVRRRSAVGEPYVNLEPKEDTDPRGGPRLGDGDQIALEDTSVPLSYEEVFSAVDRLLSAVDPHDAATLVREFAAGVEGTSDTFRRLLIDIEDITSSFADDRDNLEALTRELTALTATFASRSGAIATSIDSVDVLAETLVDSRDALLRLTDESPDLVARLAELFGETRGDLGCIIQILAQVGAELGDDESAGALDDVFEDTTLLLDILADVESQQADGTWVRVKTFFNDGSGSDSVIYEEPKPFPVPPTMQVCEFLPSRIDGAYGLERAAGDPGAADPLIVPADPKVPADRTSPPIDVPVTASSETPFAPSVLNPLLALPLLALIALVAATRPWRLLGFGRDDD